MLQNIKPDKAAGPDSLLATVLKELSHEIAPILELIYRRFARAGSMRCVRWGSIAIMTIVH